MSSLVGDCESKRSETKEDRCACVPVCEKCLKPVKKLDLPLTQRYILEICSCNPRKKVICTCMLMNISANPIKVKC
jgi:hypothetical protein